jgi:hypothetical protein
MTSPFSAFPSAEHSDDESHLTLWQPAPGVVLSRVQGRFSHTLAAPFMAFFDDIPSRRLFGVHDWTEMTGFDPSLPPRLIAFTLRLLPRSQRIVVASVSPMISMAVRAANLTLRKVELVDSLGDIEAAAERALREAERA